MADIPNILSSNPPQPIVTTPNILLIYFTNSPLAVHSKEIPVPMAGHAIGPIVISTPTSTSVVKVQALDTTLKLYVNTLNFFKPVIPGHETYNCPSLAFLITNKLTGKKVLFDAGARKDYWNFSPATADRLSAGVNVKGLRIDQGVDEVLVDAGLRLENLESVIFSHWHFDHIGDMSNFPSSVKLVVGPGFKETFIPGFPTNPKSPLLETDYSNREVQELNFDPEFKIGNFAAFDYFGDGSFYLLDVPGHAIGHMCGLARTTADTFILLGADACHFAGSLRPSITYPLPDMIDSTIVGLDSYFPVPCPCSLFSDCHPAESDESKKTEPYYTVSTEKSSAYSDPAIAGNSIKKLIEFDSCPSMFICIAHDPALTDVLPLMNINPNSEIGDWQEKGYKEATRWRFLNELPRGGQPGRQPLVMGWWRNKTQVDRESAWKRDD